LFPLYNRQQQAIQRQLIAEKSGNKTVASHAFLTALSALFPLSVPLSAFLTLSISAFFLCLFFASSLPLV
jgi:hypothetical protein